MLEAFKYKTAAHYILSNLQADGEISTEVMRYMFAVSKNGPNVGVAVDALKRGAARTRWDACCIVFASIIAAYIGVMRTDEEDKMARNWDKALHYALKETGVEDEVEISRIKSRLVAGANSQSGGLNFQSPVDVIEFCQPAFVKSLGAEGPAYFEMFMTGTKSAIDSGRLTDDDFRRFSENEFTVPEVSLALIDGLVENIKSISRNDPVDSNTSQIIEKFETVIDFIMKEHPGRLLPKNGHFAAAAEAAGLDRFYRDET